MKIVFANYYYQAQFSNEEELLRQYYTVTGWAEALQRAGAEVIVVSRFSKNSELTINNVRYIFLQDNIGPLIRAWQVPVKFLNAVASLRADVIHLHHLSLSLQTLYLRLRAGNKTAIIVQHHGGKIVRSRKMDIHNFIHRVADGYFFTTYEQGAWWFANKKQRSKIFPVMEGATFFNFDKRDAGRNQSYQQRKNLETVFLWVGRLDENKDPLTVLKGFEIIVKDFPQAVLYMIYNESKLLPQVKRAIETSHVLRERVHLKGAIPHHEIESYYQNAHLFVLGSHYEGSGYALSEALKCGCVPVVTNIPSFKMMTDEGRLGALWDTGDPISFAAAAKKALSKPLQEEGEKCTRFFNEKLSFDAIARQALEYYSLIRYK